MSGRLITTRSPSTMSYTTWLYTGASTTSSPLLIWRSTRSSSRVSYDSGNPLRFISPRSFEHAVRVEEAVRGDQVDLRMVGPLCEQRLQDAGERALADGDAAGDADDVRHLRGDRAEEGGRDLVEVLRGAHVQVEEPAQRQVDRGHLVEVDVVVDAAAGGRDRVPAASSASLRGAPTTRRARSRGTDRAVRRTGRRQDSTRRCGSPGDLRRECVAFTKDRSVCHNPRARFPA